MENLVENGNVNDLLNDALGKTLMRHELRGALLHLLLAETASPCAAVLVNVTRRDMFMKSGLDHFHQTTTGLGTPPSRLAPARLPHLKKEQDIAPRSLQHRQKNWLNTNFWCFDCSGKGTLP